MKRLFINISIFLFLIYGQMFAQFSTDLQNIDQEIITLRSHHADLFFGNEFKEIIAKRSSLETLADNDNWTVYQEEFETALENIQLLKIASEKASKDFITLLALRQRAILLVAQATVVGRHPQIPQTRLARFGFQLFHERHRTEPIGQPGKLCGVGLLIRIDVRIHECGESSLQLLSFIVGDRHATSGG